MLTSLLYASYDNQPRRYKKGELVDCRYIVYYVGVTQEQTKQLACDLARTLPPAGKPVR